MSEGNVHEVTAMLFLPIGSGILGWLHVPLYSFLIFSGLWVIGVYLITCDLDTDSNSSRLLGWLGWIINKLFKHQGTLHNPYFWAVIGILGYFGIGWFWLGLIIPQYIHLTMDWIF